MSGYTTGVNKLTPMSLLNKVKRLLGIKSFILPFSDEELLQILYEDTLPVFSIYFPRYYRKQMNIKDLEPVRDSVVSGLPTRYYLNGPEFEQMQIIDIEDVKLLQPPIDMYHAHSYNRGMDAYSLVAESFAEASLQSMLNTPIVCKIEPPNILLFDAIDTYMGGLMEFKFLVCHAPDLSTLQYSWREMILELYKYDVQILLYNELKHYDNIDTMFGNIELKIDDWQDALSRREELILKWKEGFLRFREQSIFIR